MAAKIPETTRSLFTAKFGPPSKYEIGESPTPKITRKNEVLIKVHAAALNPTDIGGANGRYWPAFKVPLPFKIGYDLAGTVVGAGESVSRLKVGDEVFCSLPFKDGDRFGTGAVSEYVTTPEEFVIAKPKNLNFVEAASLPMVTMTTLQMIERIEGGKGLEGKVVFVPAGLSGVGSIAVQMAKNIFGAKKVITTVSTDKLSKVSELLGEGVADEVIDYTKSDLSTLIPANSIDIMLDTIGTVSTCLPLLAPNSTVIACAGPPPSGRNLKNISPEVPGWVSGILNFEDNLRKWRIGRSGVKFDSVLMKASGEELERIRGWVEEGKIKPVVGKVVRFSGGLEEIKGECDRISKGKGGLGKVVVEFDV